MRGKSSVSCDGAMPSDQMLPPVIPRWIANDCQNLGRLGFIAVGQKAFSKFDRQSQDDHLNQGRLVELGLKAKGKS